MSTENSNPINERKPKRITKRVSTGDVYSDMTTDVNATSEVLEDVSLDLIDLAENQPRKLNLSKKDIIEIRDGKRDILEERKENPKFKARWEKFLALSTSIKASKVNQPVKLFRKGPRFEVLTGERRTLASLFAEKETVPALVYADEPEAVQAYEEMLSENAAKEDLELKEDVQSIVDYFYKLQLHRSHTGTVKDVMKIGHNKTKAYILFAIVSSTDLCLDLIEEDRIIKIGAAEKFAKLSEKDQKAIAKSVDGEITLDKIKKYVDDQKKKTKPANKRAGAPARFYQLGKIDSPDVMKLLIDRIGVKPEGIGSLDWNDKKAVNEIWEKIIESLKEDAK